MRCLLSDLALQLSKWATFWRLLLDLISVLGNYTIVESLIETRNVPYLEII